MVIDFADFPIASISYTDKQVTDDYLKFDRKKRSDKEMTVSLQFKMEG